MRTGALDLNSGPSPASSGTALMIAAFSAALAAASTGGLLVANPPAAPFAFGFAASGMSFGTDSCHKRRTEASENPDDPDIAAPWLDASTAARLHAHVHTVIGGSEGSGCVSASAARITHHASAYCKCQLH